MPAVRHYLRAVALLLRADLHPSACGARWLGAGGQGLLVEDTAFGTASLPAFTASGCRGACAWGEGRVRTSQSMTGLLGHSSRYSQRAVRHVLSLLQSTNESLFPPNTSGKGRVAPSASSLRSRPPPQPPHHPDPQTPPQTPPETPPQTPPQPPPQARPGHANRNSTSQQRNPASGPASSPPREGLEDRG